MTTTLPRATHLRACEDHLRVLRDEAADTAARLRTDRELTAEGRRARFAAAAERGRWAERLAELDERMTSSITAGVDRAAELRTGMTTPTGDTHSQVLAELRYARRSEQYRAALADNPTAASAIIRAAAPDDVPLLVEALPGLAEGRHADVVAGAVEQGLRTRSGEYADAVALSSKAEVARHAVAAQLDAARREVADLDAETPHPSALSERSVEVVDVALGGLPADAD